MHVAELSIVADVVAPTLGSVKMPGSDALRALFLAIPSDGSWWCPIGDHIRTLMILLDEGSSYIEENLQPDDQTMQVPWMVRLTLSGKLAVAAVLTRRSKL